MYPYTRKDSHGEELDGSKHNYTLTFAKGQFPPVNAFWSVTMYDGQSQLLIENPINRYLINSPMFAGDKEKPRWITDDLHPKQMAGKGERIELAAGAPMASFTCCCACTGRRRNRRRYCLRARVPGSHRAFCRCNELPRPQHP